MPDLQRYPWILNLIKNVEDNVVFPTQSVPFCEFSITSYNQEMSKQLLHRNQNENEQFNKTKHTCFTHAWSDKAFKGTVVNRASLQLEITLTSLTIIQGISFHLLHKPVNIENNPN